MTDVPSFRMKVGAGCAHSVIVVAAVTVATITVVVVGDLVMMSVTVIVDFGIEIVEVVFTVVVEGMIERQEQAEDISEDGKVQI